MPKPDDPEEALMRAERVDPNNPFVAKLRAFYTERGHLSPKQLAALARVTPTFRSAGIPDEDDPDFEDWLADDAEVFGHLALPLD